jgi:hypothetical protein
MSPSALKSLNFVAKSVTGTNPTTDRRTRIIAKLEEQKQLAANPNFRRGVRRRVEKDGVRTLEDFQTKVLPWWKATANGYEFAIRLARFVEFEKGKPAISVASLDQLPKTIDTLITAIRAGELDAQLAAASTKPQAKKVVKK